MPCTPNSASRRGPPPSSTANSGTYVLLLSLLWGAADRGALPYLGLSPLNPIILDDASAAAPAPLSAQISPDLDDVVDWSRDNKVKYVMIEDPNGDWVLNEDQKWVKVK
ncbi:hypothetical protein DTO271G3_1480 [Paecilomyces variotii]|nr:hypothetical protein DTO271G3_1480 [Paecilomyces variotii]